MVGINGSVLYFFHLTLATRSGHVYILKSNLCKLYLFSVSGADFSTGVAELAAMAKVGPHYDSRVRLSALATVLKTAPHPAPPPKYSETVDKPSDVMDLLFISELRTLQTSINEALVAVQQITADPKTDTTLGQVGR